MPRSRPRRKPPEPLFPKLPRHHGLPSPEHVGHHQRQRLMGAMVEAVRRHGYPEVTVTELVGLAGVSKAAFYRMFKGKRECFAATFSEIVKIGAERVEAAYRSGEGLTGRLQAGLDAFAEIIASEPAAASLVIVDSLALGEPGVGLREGAAQRFEALIAQSFASEGHSLSDLQARALIAGWRRLAYRALRASEPARLRAQVPELSAWALSYREGDAEVPAPTRSAPPKPPPAEGLDWSEPPASKLARQALTQRQRIVRAAAQLATTHGYEALTIEAISERAGTSNEGFYKHFTSRREPFLEAFDLLSTRALGVAVAAFESAGEWEGGVTAGIAALLAHTATDPYFARIAFFELGAAGPAGMARSDATLGSFTAYLHPESFGARTPNQVPPVTVEAIGGGIWSAIQHELEHGRAQSLAALAPQFAALALAPFEV
jgi:AcrR family transcriptional regulator